MTSSRAPRARDAGRTEWQAGRVFERFTERARRVLVLAQDEELRLGHGFVGTEHILLGLIRDGEGVAAETLLSTGVSLDAARQKVVAIIGPDTKAAPHGSPPFTPRAKKVLELSLIEAKLLGHARIGSEHLLLGLLREGEGVAVQVLVDLGIDLEGVRRALFDRMRVQEHEEEAIQEGPQGDRHGTSGSHWSRVGHRMTGGRGRPPRPWRRGLPRSTVVALAGGAIVLTGCTVSVYLAHRRLAARLAEVETQLDRLVALRMVRSRHARAH